MPALEELNGAGVFYGGPASEAHGLAGRDVYVVGGANSAGQAALHLARFARQRDARRAGGSLAAGMSHYLARQIEATPNVEVRLGTEVVGGGGERVAPAPGAPRRATARRRRSTPRACSS